MSSFAVILFLISVIGAVVSLVAIIMKAVKKLPKRKAALALMLFFALFIVSVIVMPSNTVSQESTTLPIVSADPVQSEEPEPEEKPLVYAEDKVVNQFIDDYNKITSSPITNIKKGNIRTKYYFDSYGFVLQIINATDALAGHTEVSINGNMEAQVPEMKDVFHDVVKVLDPDLSDEEINTFFDARTVSGNCAKDTPLGRLTCSVYLTGNASGKGRIDIHN